MFAALVLIIIGLARDHKGITRAFCGIARGALFAKFVWWQLSAVSSGRSCMFASRFHMCVDCKVICLCVLFAY